MDRQIIAPRVACLRIVAVEFGALDIDPPQEAFRWAP